MHLLLYNVLKFPDIICQFFEQLRILSDAGFVNVIYNFLSFFFSKTIQKIECLFTKTPP